MMSSSDSELFVQGLHHRLQSPRAVAPCVSAWLEGHATLYYQALSCGNFPSSSPLAR